tara:strand:+ start:165 stop:350 length:186 start_codon:yes stop_codon:yes gene_type:complete
MSKNNNRSEQQQVDVFEEISAEATKDNIVTKDKERVDKSKRLEDLEKTMSSIKWANDPLDW